MSAALPMPRNINMGKAPWLFLFLLFFGACAHSPPRNKMNELESKYKVGDFVEYKFSGTYRETPIFLREEVIEKVGLQLTILVEKIAGGSKTTWKQIVVDTEENQRSNRVERLLEISETGADLELKNTNNGDLLRLFSGTFLDIKSPMKNITSANSKILVCGVEYPVTIIRGSQEVGGKTYDFEAYESDLFVWKHLGASYKRNGELFYRAEVVNCGAPIRKEI